ncbi:hypothetical protein O3M35_005028 [Rhynocoris fuscipes]|uniref:SET domain-containing protein n=1 Tax=Rhynocoris fuscipes TaxID=488301 RepID=A0AAW1DHK6_9HEMI
MDDLNVLLRERNGYDSNALWIIKSCSYCDRGMFATRDIRAGELVFKDRPTVVGPKVSEMAPGCAVCMTGDLPLIACSKLCALPVCYGGQCENLPIHENDCKLLRQLAGDVSIDNTYWSPQLFKSLALLRCINMPQKERNIVRLLHTHKGKQTMIQINWLKNALPNGLSDEDEKWLLHCCGVLNGLAFEIPETNEESKKKRLHGLYPLAGMMNHSCSPNTERLFTTEDEVPMMSVVATVDIAKDTEITTAYCPLLWSTPTRRKFLFITKEFLCYCPRCQDSTVKFHLLYSKLYKIL